MKSKLTESQHSDICIKPISLLNKEWGDKNPPRTTQLNRKMKKKKKYKIPLTIIKNPQAGERGGGGKDFARDLIELMTRERRGNYWLNTTIY